MDGHIRGRRRSVQWAAVAARRTVRARTRGRLPDRRRGEAGSEPSARVRIRRWLLHGDRPGRRCRWRSQRVRDAARRRAPRPGSADVRGHAAARTIHRRARCRNRVALGAEQALWFKTDAVDEADSLLRAFTATRWLGVRMRTVLVLWLL